MTIQMKDNNMSMGCTHDILIAYKNYLAADVRSFTQEEQQSIQKTFEQIHITAQQLNIHILPTELKLIKSSGSCYGSSAYYTSHE